MLYKIKKNSFTLVVIITMTLISACGYSLRGSLNLPPSLNHISVYSDNYSELVNSINETLLSSGIRVTNSNNQTVDRILILSESFNRRQLTMSVSGRVNEYELIYDIDYEINLLNKKTLSDSITLYRDYSFDENNVMGNSDREEYIKNEMVSTAATLIFNKLKAYAK
tara:strand:- start:896 stop:1396 length:501 start_codon:yes stop_codon:yes gene_type:complete